MVQKNKNISFKKITFKEVKSLKRKLKCLKKKLKFLKGS